MYAKAHTPKMRTIRGTCICSVPCYIDGLSFIKDELYWYYMYMSTFYVEHVDPVAFDSDEFEEHFIILEED
jgi:hypothetical protein|tara:strand:+ start:3938 stop:4150 length:213 start_codon:yes stop_codon:yes gene_type:complete